MPGSQMRLDVSHAGALSNCRTVIGNITYLCPCLSRLSLRTLIFITHRRSSSNPRPPRRLPIFSSLMTFGTSLSGPPPLAGAAAPMQATCGPSLRRPPRARCQPCLPTRCRARPLLAFERVLFLLLVWASADIRPHIGPTATSQGRVERSSASSRFGWRSNTMMITRQMPRPAKRNQRIMLQAGDVPAPR